MAFQFGYEGTGNGWLVRRTAYSNVATVTAATTASGIYRMQLIVNFDANPTVIGGQTFNDGAGTLYVKQLADASGNPVNDIFRLADPTTANVDLGIATGMGTACRSALLANWDGVLARVTETTERSTTSRSRTASRRSRHLIGPPNSGNWLTSGNFYLTTPNGIGAEADFTAGATSDATVFADSAVTVGTMKINNPHSYVFSGAGSLTLQTSSGSKLCGCRTGEASCKDQSSADHRQQHDVQRCRRRDAENFGSDDRQCRKGRHADRQRGGCV